MVKWKRQRTNIPLYCLLWVIVCPLSFSFDHCIVCYGSMFVLFLFHLTIVLSVMGQCLSFVFFNEKDKGQTLTHNRQYNGQMKKTKDKQWPITDNTMVKWKRQRTNFFFFILPLHCLLWVNVCPLCFSFDHCIVCYGLLFVLCLFRQTLTHNRQYNGQMKKTKDKHWPITENTMVK
jgi:hypothetical protein